MLKQVISGGQTGADQAGLAAARFCGIPTGGWAPKGYKTLDGNNLHLKYIYNLKEHEGGYKERTWANVQDSDGTIRFAFHFGSDGERCTLNAIKHYIKPDFKVDLPIEDSQKDAIIAEVLEWITKHKISVLNVAGNSEKTYPGMYRMVSKFLVEIFRRLYDEQGK